MEEAQRLPIVPTAMTAWGGMHGLDVQLPLPNTYLPLFQRHSCPESSNMVLLTSAHWLCEESSAGAKSNSERAHSSRGQYLCLQNFHILTINWPLSAQARRCPDQIFVSLHSDLSQELLPSSSNPTPKHRTLDLHINLIERVHNRLNPNLVDIHKEQLDSLFRLRRFRIRSYGCACAGCVCS